MKDSSGLSGLGAGFPDGSVSKESACNAGDLGLISGWGRSPGERNGSTLQNSFLRNPTDRGAWRATVHGVARSRTRLSNLHSLTQGRGAPVTMLALQ